ncbi:DUF881 domain-containing protein [Actinoplanes siamensis]|uniref:Membrane protein n=1 Tax=Actinoplanes siamensis TaxID=1223317 RepID=A0A919KBQ6_9ACTN|nr:DUF881 domain-containing protein [Actinoplanes siamensis]GIF03368.1 membrane protein [Actinoplanes siamensis]
MTDRDDNGRDQTPPDLGLPTAGRKPPAADVSESIGGDPVADRPRLDPQAPAPAAPAGGDPAADRARLDGPAPVAPAGGDGADPAATRESEPDAGETSPTSPVTSMPETPGSANPERDLDRGGAKPGRGGLKRPAPAGTLIWVLLALLGFTLVVQLRSNDADSGLSTMRQEDLVQILSDLEARDSRLNTDIEALERNRQQLTSGVQGREAALEEANKRSQELGLLAGTIPGRGPGLEIVMDRVKASDVLNTVQELRGSGGEVMQISGANGASVRIVASTYFVDATGGGIIADGGRLAGPFRLLVIGSPETMRTALQIPGGVVASVKSDGGSVTMDSAAMVEVTAVRKATALQYARPVS